MTRYVNNVVINSKSLFLPTLDNLEWQWNLLPLPHESFPIFTVSFVCLLFPACLSLSKDLYSHVPGEWAWVVSEAPYPGWPTLPFPALAAALRISAPGVFLCRLEQLRVKRSTEVPGIWVNPFHEVLKQARSTYHELVAPNMSATGERGLDRQGWEIPALTVFSIIAYVFMWFLGLASTIWFATLLSI